MVLQFLNKILALILALIVIFSSLSFTVEKHICMDEVTDVSFFTEADTCEMQTDECEDTGIKDHTGSFDDQDCCTNVHELIPGTNIEQPALDGFEINTLPFIITYAFTYLNLFKDNKEHVPFSGYISPHVLTDRNIQILYQTFLI